MKPSDVIEVDGAVWEIVERDVPHPGGWKRGQPSRQLDRGVVVRNRRTGVEMWQGLGSGVRSLPSDWRLRVPKEPSDDTAERIERVYMAIERTDDPRGARAWFARRAHSHPTTVSRWLAGGLSGPALGLLEEMERRVEAVKRSK